MATTQAKKSQFARVAESTDVEEGIRLRAYELYEARGREDGHDLDDWLRAEEEMKIQKTHTVAA